MPFRLSSHRISLMLGFVAVTAIAAPAQAQMVAPPPVGAGYAPQYDQAAWEDQRAAWLDECRANHRGGRKGKTIGGALVGGVVGGLVGNAVAGRGDKTLGTIAGAAVGAAAGGALGSGADRRDERRSIDYCESYLERHTASGYGQPGYGYTYAYQPMTVMVPVMIAQAQPIAASSQPRTRECTETQVIEEWVPVGPRKRYIPPRPRPLPDKRIRLAPDKRIPVN
ncbi:glycine zipper 2TM domain-containing protein [Novosphingobium sp.]|uniref:glycine zipper 2TM domain-containing protein n=1 Tax=Novosphingobium sp. TaxID=1874826 RepID=UPI0025E8113C|nr:glycine zipper 2TM domain-containing protein [Novosphingobium sp.]